MMRVCASVGVMGWEADKTQWYQGGTQSHSSAEWGVRSAE